VDRRDSSVREIQWLPYVVYRSYRTIATIILFFFFDVKNYKQ